MPKKIHECSNPKRGHRKSTPSAGATPVEGTTLDKSQRPKQKALAKFDHFESTEVVGSPSAPYTDEMLLKLETSDTEWERVTRIAEEFKQYLLHPKPTRKLAGSSARRLKVSIRSFYRLLDIFKVKGVAGLVRDRPGVKQKTKRLSDSTEALLTESITKSLAKGEARPVRAIYEDICDNFRKSQLKPPALGTVKRRLKLRSYELKLRRNFGCEVAKDRLALYTETVEPEHPLEFVQLDHTPVDVIIVDDILRTPLGRPWLTLIIDVKTRVVLGFYVSLDRPNAASVGVAICSAVLPKDAFLKRHELSHIEWPVWGKMKRLGLDNAKEHHATSVVRAAQQQDIEVEFRPLGRKHFGGHIERLIGTFMGRVHLLPGTTFSNTKVRKGYDSEARAAISGSELVRWLTAEIAVYYNTVHRGLNTTPMQAWLSGWGCARGGQLPRIIEDKRTFCLSFLPSETRTVGHGGIRIFGLRYNAPVLKLAMVQHDNVRVYYDPRDISVIFVRLRDGTFVDVPWVYRTRAPISLSLYRFRTRSMRRNAKSVSEADRLVAIDTRNEIVSDAEAKTRRARRQKGSEALHVATMEPLKRPPMAALPSPKSKVKLFDDASPIPVFEVEES